MGTNKSIPDLERKEDEKYLETISKRIVFLEDELVRKNKLIAEQDKEIKKGLARIGILEKKIEKQKVLKEAEEFCKKKMLEGIRVNRELY